MWRAFFFAIGSILLILGLQCLVVDKFFVRQNGKVSGLINKALNAIDDNPSPNKTPKQPTNLANGFSLPAQQTSAYGPSRFQTGPYGFSNNAYGTGSNFANANRNNRNPNTFQASFVNGNGGNPNAIGANTPKALRIVHPKDWMPWSLLAAGSIILLYTKSLGHAHSYSNE